MTAPHMINPARMLGQALSEASPDLTRHLLTAADLDEQVAAFRTRSLGVATSETREARHVFLRRPGRRA